MSASTHPRVLVVEDNPITRKMIRFTLESGGYEVVETDHGREALRLIRSSRPNLVLQDLALPDMEGLDLLQEIRKERSPAELPVFVLSGRAAKLDELRAEGGSFDEYLTKPMEPSRLLAAIGERLASRSLRPRVERPGRRVLVVDDEALNRKLADLRLADAGFSVATASSGREALEAARRAPPDAVLSDVLMPGLDGYQLCRELREDPALSHVPVVLISASYVDEADRRLARDMGASALVPRTSDYGEAARALDEVLASREPPPVPPRTPEVEREYRQRVHHQLDRMVKLNGVLTQRTALQAATLSVLSGLADVLARPSAIADVLTNVLLQTLDSTGLSTGLLWIREEDGAFRLLAYRGLPGEGSVRAAKELDSGHLARLIAAGSASAFDAGSAPEELAPLMAGLGRSSVLVVPLMALQAVQGAIVLASDTDPLSDASWLAFARSLSLHLGQAVALARTLSDLAASDARVKASERYFRTLIENASDMITVVDPEGIIRYASPSVERVLGFPPAEVCGKSAFEFIHLDDRAAVAGSLALRFENPQEPRPTEFRFRHRGGGWRVLQTRGSILSGSDGPPSIVLNARDVSDQKLLEEQLRHSQKMEAVGRLAGGVAHDFNNLLTIISGYGDLLRGGVPPDSPERESVEEIMAAATRATDLTRQLLAFSRKQVLEPRVLDLNRVVQGMDRLLHRVLGEDVQLLTVLEPRIAPVLADPGQIEQILMNLAVNARDAMPEGGKLTIETRSVELDEAYVREHVKVKSGPYVMLAVSDTGTGMDEETLAHAFEPFFTTKGPGKGTGLGLSTVYGIVEQSGGNLFAYSVPGRGTTFKIYLPRVAKNGTGERAPRISRRLAAVGRGTVLLVEDDPAVRRLARDVLSAKGYGVLEAADGDTALRIAREHGQEIDLMLSDVVMPEIGGPDLAARIRELRPGIRVLFMSGYSDEAVTRHGILEEGTAFIGKPFTPASLLEKVHEVIGS